MSIALRKGLIYVASIGFMMSLLLALWATDGCRNFAAWSGKPLCPFVWGIALFCLALVPLLLTRWLANRLQMRTVLELCARGTFCGLMVSSMWACAYLGYLVLKECEINLELYLMAAALILAVGLAVIGVCSDCFLRNNLYQLGGLISAAGGLVIGAKHPLIGEAMVAAGIALALSTIVVSGHVPYSRWGYREISREQSPFAFGLTVAMLGLLLGIVLFDLLRRGWAAS
jgi:hypothetical protein